MITISGIKSNQHQSLFLLISSDLDLFVTIFFPNHNGKGLDVEKGCEQSTWGETLGTAVTFMSAKLQHFNKGPNNIDGLMKPVFWDRVRGDSEPASQGLCRQFSWDFLRFL